ncbi:MAG: hypothetical protein P8078_05640, partial [bacterium]
MKSVIKGDRVIAVFDILGFSNLVKGTKLSLLPELMENINNFTEGSLVSKDFRGHILFSDTIILYGKRGDSIAEPELLIIASSNLLNVFARNGILLRGALTFGPIFIDSNKNIIVGSSLVKGYNLEIIQEWAGAIVDLEFEDFYRKGLKHSPESLQCNLTTYPAPMKTGKRINYGCIGWMHRAELDWDKIENLFFPYKNAIKEHDIYRKFLNTKEYLDSCS